MVKSHVPVVFGALADPTRMAMVKQLARGEATVGALGRPFDISTPAVLKHVGVLEAAGVIRTEKRGRVRVCRLNPKALDTAAAWIDDRRRTWETRLDSLEALIGKEER